MVGAKDGDADGGVEGADVGVKVVGPPVGKAVVGVEVAGPPVGRAVGAEVGVPVDGRMNTFAPRWLARPAT